ncbi:nitrate ABC transporter permease [Synechococcus sp. PCC 6717]|jgi:nitrate/nitrite transport system permease protein|uniref:Nitrate ABC transporter, permease protein n=1 Tax=Parathermosynechococcus lividus PCC 6715 TaxID=1917166 RepID=A0A2D2Q332_PARLV|nr:nitrate ABC transporter permease [Thermostichus lividus]ATS18914.1 nitrate ABC transporter, permease protein [Thermostichus lividus PCC 6715]MCH9056222.1 nitrate ABC transporter permease [Synechococcus sp. PCC 6716]MCI3280502.1 nitrate ABC transporter permease [Synechococcus sp. PCC 6717]
MTSSSLRVSRRQRWFKHVQRLPVFRKVLLGSLGVVCFLALWQLICMVGLLKLPTPLKVIADTWELIIDPFYTGSGNDVGLGWQILSSLRRVAIGFSLAAIAGVGLGMLIGASRVLYDAVDPILQVLRPVPPLAWLPISLAAMRDNEPAAIFVIFITAIWPIIINTIVGVQQIPKDYKNVARVLRLSRKDYFLNILVPATVPYVFTGLRIGIGLSWLAIVAAEMLIGGVGIGFFIWDAWNSSLVSEIIVAVIYVGIVGLVLDRSVAFAGRLLSHGDEAHS